MVSVTASGPISPKQSSGAGLAGSTTFPPTSNVPSSPGQPRAALWATGSAARYVLSLVWRSPSAVARSW